MQNDMRDRLKDILQRASYIQPFYTSDGELVTSQRRFVVDYDIAEEFADFLIEQGVIVPPCKVGDTVYSLREASCEDINEVHAVCEHYGFGTDDRICTLEKPQKCPYRYRIFKRLVTEYNLLSLARVWGKTVFLTKEEAERALAERMGKE